MVTLHFTFERSTKNTHRYNEDSQLDALITVGALYVQKSVFPDPPPKLIITITPGA